MRFWITRGRLLRLWVPGGSVLALGGCGLSDQQLTSMLTSIMTTGLSTIVNSIVSALTAGAGG